MTKFKILPILSFMIALTGCSLPMNHSQQEQQITMHTDHWINNDPDAQQKLAQGLTAYLAMSDAYQSIASRVHLIRKAQYTLDLQYYIWADDFIGNLM